MIAMFLLSGALAGAPEPRSPAPEGWVLLQGLSEEDVFGMPLSEQAAQAAKAGLPALLAALGASEVARAWRWPDTRVFPDDLDGRLAVPPPIRQAPLQEVRITVLGVGEHRGEPVLRVRVPEGVWPEDTLVTRLRDEHLPLVGARQQVYDSFSLSCPDVEMKPLALGKAPLALTPGGRATCTRLPLDGGWLLATEHPVGTDGSCVVSVQVSADGSQRSLGTTCRADIVGPMAPDRREHAREHQKEMAYSSGAGPGSPEGWFRAPGGQTLFLLNQFQGALQTRCLATLPEGGEGWRPLACVRGAELGSY